MKGKQFVNYKKQQARKKRLNDCKKKIKYPDLDAALAALPFAGRQLAPYKCEFGAHYHLGHQRIFISRK